MYKSIPHFIKETTKQYGWLPAFSLKVGFRTKTYTYQQIHDYLYRMPALFAKLGIKSGDRIVVLSLNRPEYAILILGAFISGVTLVPIDYRTNHETIAKFIKLTSPKAIFTSNLFRNLFHGFEQKAILFDGFLDQLNAFPPKDPPSVDPEHLAAILFTSGTTGEPKGTIITYANILASINSARSVFILPKQLKILSILPLSHALEMFGGLMVTYSFGCHIHYLERINSITIIQALRRYQIEAMAVVPQMLRLLLQNIERRVKEDKKMDEWNLGHQFTPYLPKSLRRLVFHRLHDRLGGSFSFFVCGSAPLELKLAQTWERMGIGIVEGYGASETTAFVSTNTLASNNLGTVGKILPGITTKQTESGELLVAGDNIVSGYFHNEEKTKEAFTDGWFHTGDIVTFDRNGCIRIVGRDKFKIVLPDGKKVYPEDIEKKLNNHPLVTDSMVFGLKTSEGESVHAEVITKQPRKLAQIVETVNKMVNPHEQILDYGLWLHADFPRTKTLKIDRDEVIQEVLKRKAGKEVVQDQAEEQRDKLLRILITVSGKKHVKMHGNIKLSTDLQLDSLKRIELLALIEEEMGVSIDELKIKPQTTISDLRNLIVHGKPTVLDDGETIPRWQLTPTMDSVRVFFQENLAFPVFDIGIKLKVRHPENIAKIKTPQLFIFNHVGVSDAFQALRAMPQEIRRKTAIIASHMIWRESWYQPFFAVLFGNTVPFVRAESHQAMRGNFERVGELLDKGYNVLMSPEGNITHTGELLPFHTGAGYIAVEMGLPVTHFKLFGYYELWPDESKRRLNLFWPKKFGTVEVAIGEPIQFAKDTSYEKATQVLRQIMLDLQ